MAPEAHHIINLAAVERLPRDVFEAHRGEYAVVKDGVIVSYHKMNREALTEAHKRFGKEKFSVQRIEIGPHYI